MADNRYRNNLRINRHRPLSLTLSNPNHPLNHGWSFSHYNEDYDQPVYTQEGIKLMRYFDSWLLQFPNGDAIEYSHFEREMEELTEDALKELADTERI